MVKILSAFNCFERARVLVVGDLILDVYTFGKIRRISPEAPVSVMEAERDEMRLGGAANVALNLKSLGMDVSLLGCIGDDEAGKDFLDLLLAERIEAHGVICEKNRATSMKNRLIAGGQQVIRVDREVTKAISTKTANRLLEVFAAELKQASVVLFSDYAKGVLTPEILEKMLVLAKGLPTIVDPKGTDFTRYRGATLIKPNLKETYEAAGVDELEEAARILLAKTGAEKLFVTRASDGISVFDKKNGRSDHPTRGREVKDVTGAGDTVCAILACCIANGWCDAEMAELANVAASISIEQIGCARVSLSQLAKRLLELHLTTKVFEESHLFALRHVLEEHPFALLTVRGCTTFSAALFEAVRTLKKLECELVLYLDKASCHGELLDILASIEEVDYIILHNDSLKDLCAEITPRETYIFEDGHLCKFHESVFTLR